MFTGIIESLGTIEKIRREGANTSFFIKSVISPELKVDQSVSHNGVCLTVVELADGGHWVTAIRETLQKSTLGSLALHSHVNLERCMLNNGRFDGHIVQGHADGIGTVVSIEQDGFARRLRVGLGHELLRYVVEKGSLALDGVSLTVSGLGEGWAEVSLIPETLERTTLGGAAEGDKLNVECDVVAQYVERLMKPFVGEG
jgi:riboflavin synthase